MNKYMIVRNSDLSLIGYYRAAMPMFVLYSKDSTHVLIPESLIETRLYAFKENDEIRLAELPEEAPVEPEPENP